MPFKCVGFAKLRERKVKEVSTKCSDCEVHRIKGMQ